MMKQNIINNFSPILALKTYYINKCLEAKLNENSLPSEIPRLEISRTLTTSIPGFNDNYVVSWKNKIIRDEAFVVVRMIDSNTPIKYMLYKISNVQSNTNKYEVYKALELNNNDNVIEYNITIPYDSSNEYFDEIKSNYCFNVLNCTEWVDYITPSRDNLEMISLVRKFGLVLMKMNYNSDKIFKYIFINPGLIPTPQIITYVVSNKLTGKEYILKSFTDKNIAIVTRKEKVKHYDSDAD